MSALGCGFSLASVVVFTCTATCRRAKSVVPASASGPARVVPSDQPANAAAAASLSDTVVAATGTLHATHSWQSQLWGHGGTGLPSPQRNGNGNGATGVGHVESKQGGPDTTNTSNNSNSNNSNTAEPIDDDGIEEVETIEDVEAIENIESKHDNETGPGPEPQPGSQRAEGAQPGAISQQPNAEEDATAISADATNGAAAGDGDGDGEASMDEEEVSDGEASPTRPSRLGAARMSNWI